MEKRNIHDEVYWSPEQQKASENKSDRFNLIPVEEYGPVKYPFMIKEGRKCNICGRVFVAEIEHLNHWQCIAPEGFIESLLQHRQEHLDKGHEWKAWEILWGDKVSKV